MADMFKNVSVEQLLKLSRFEKVLNNLASSSLKSHGFSEIPVKLIFEPSNSDVAWINDTMCVINAQSPFDKGTGFIERKRLQVGKLTHEVFGHGLFTDFDKMNEFFDANNFNTFAKYFDGCNNKTEIQYYCDKYFPSFKNLFMYISNIVEDPCIERLALVEYPGLKSYLDELVKKLQEHFVENFTIKNDISDILNLLLAQARGFELWKDYVEIYPELNTSSELMSDMFKRDTYDKRQYLTAALFSVFFPYIEKQKEQETPKPQKPQKSGNGEGNQRNEQNSRQSSGIPNSSQMDNSSSNDSSDNENQSDSKYPNQNSSSGDNNNKNSDSNEGSNEDNSKDNSEDGGNKEKTNENDDDEGADSENTNGNQENNNTDDDADEQGQQNNISDTDKNILDNLEKVLSESKQTVINQACKNNPQLQADLLVDIINEGIGNPASDGLFFIDSPNNGCYLNEYNTLFTSDIKRITVTLSKKFKKSFKERQKGYIMYNLDEGTDIDVQSYCEGSKKIFCEQILPNNKPICSCALMIDMSGSMSGSKILAAVRSAIVLEYFCRLLNIPFMAYGHNYGNVTNIYKMVGFGDKKNNISASNIVTGLNTCGCNHDGVAIRYGLGALKVNRSNKKLFFIISDGQPNADNYGIYQMQQEMPKIKKLAKKNNIALLPIAIDTNSLVKIESIYGSVINGVDLKELPNEIIRLTEKEIKKLI